MTNIHTFQLIDFYEGRDILQSFKGEDIAKAYKISKRYARYYDEEEVDGECDLHFYIDGKEAEDWYY